MYVKFRLLSLSGLAEVVAPVGYRGQQIRLHDPERVFLFSGTVGCQGLAEKRRDKNGCKFVITSMVCPPPEDDDGENE